MTCYDMLLTRLIIQAMAENCLIINKMRQVLIIGHMTLSVMFK